MTAYLDKKHIILILFLTIASISLVKATRDTLKSNQRLEDLREEVTQLEEQKRVLSDEIEYKKSPSYVEDEARDTLSLIKPGEKVFVVEGENIRNRDIDLEESSGVLGESAGTGFKDSNVYAWFKLFFD